MNNCQSVMAVDGEHRLEYHRSADGGDYYICVNANCGETIHQFIDGIGG